ncbi:MAG: cyclic nucleotide-binding domain-containing protein, partial [Gammaproteobacteria bacterium]|nr:cyclic nucleotide-binding domain-containing protein [Gammaproteobacteria bacterium]
MKNAPKQIDRKTLKILEPLNRLNPILLDELAAKSIIDEIPAGRIICRHGEKDSRQIYLLAGQIEVATAGETKTTIIKSKSALKTPIAEGSPRTVTLKTKTASTLLYIDADLLELLMSDEPELTSAAYEVTEISADDSDDWMLTFLQSPAFLQLPTENIQKLLTHMEEFPLEKGQTVINQGDKDDFYYIIKSGSCNVHRKPYKDAANVLLAVLQAGSGFGEEALISDGSRNATITMRENGSLMRLKKADFLALLIEPIISYFAHKDIQNKIDNGCVVIDVRSEQQSNQEPLEGSVNIPLSMLRVKFDSLNADREYLLVCNDGSQSAAAAFLMIQSGLKCSVLKNGLNSLKNSTKMSAKAKPAIPAQETTASAKAKKQAAVAKKQTEQIAAQQQQIKDAREKAEQDIIKHKKELAESRARITKKNQPISSADTKTAQLKDKATKELAKAMAESKSAALHQKETNETMLRAKEVMEQSAAAAEQTRTKAKEEAALIKQTAL